MSTPQMSQFLEGLQSSRLLDNGRIEEVLRRPEAPKGDVEGVARFLESSGWLTRFQIDEVRQGRGAGLMFAGYRLVSRLPDQPSGQAFKAVHPIAPLPVVLRWLNPVWLQPTDNLREYLERARTVSQLSHPHLVTLFDAGLYEEKPYIAQEHLDGADLGYLVNEMGALPVQLACEYARQAATALQAAHERGIFHGDLSPSRLILAPVIRKQGVNGTGQAVSVRPAPGSMIKVEDMGLIPRRPAAGATTFSQSHLLGAVNYLAPERLTSADVDAKTDIYSLGATLYFLLAARPPFQATSAVDAMLQLQQATPVRIDALRKDCSAALADLVARMLSKDPAARPSSAGSVAQYLQPFTQFGSAGPGAFGPGPVPGIVGPGPVGPGVVGAGPPGPFPPVVSPFAVPMAEAVAIPDAIPVAAVSPVQRAVALPHVEPLPEDTSESRVVTPRAPKVEPLPEDTSESRVVTPRAPKVEPIQDGHHEVFAANHRDEPTPLRKREKVKGGYTWLILGLCLHITAIGALVAWAMGIGPFAPSTTSEQKMEKKEKPSDKPARKKF